jgi:hypothetical protein
MRTIFGLTLACAVALTAPGCAPKPTVGSQPNAKDEHDHPNVGPHKGAIAEWGDHDYILEFTVDHDTKEATVYVLDGKAKDPKPIPSKALTLSLKQAPAVTFTLDPKPQAGDPAGQASRFVGKHDTLAEKKEFSGTLSGDVSGKKYSGTFKEEPDDHGHKH